MLYSHIYNSPIGTISLLSNGDSLIGLWLEGQKYHGFDFKKNSDHFENPINNPIVFKEVIAWLDKYFLGESPDPSVLSLSPRGGQFRQIVWKILTEIPYGQVVTYGEIAKKTASIMGKTSMSAQAVGGAISHNPISIIIPCHRVVGSSGNLTGYAGGIDKKIKLLELEGVNKYSSFQ